MFSIPLHFSSFSQTNADAAIITGELIGKQVNDLTQSWAGSYEAAADATRQIEYARRKFWATYPDKPGAKEARIKFAKMLRDKDIFYLNLALYGEQLNRNSNAGGVTLPRTQRIQEDLEHMEILVGGGGIDRGIPDFAFPKFTRWVLSFAEALSEAADGQFLNLFDPGVYETAMENSSEDYRKYRELRDIAEFDREGIPLPEEDTPSGYVRALFRRTSYVESWPETHTEYSALVKIFGEDYVTKTTRKVMKAPKNPNGGIENLDQFKIALSPYDPADSKPLPEDFNVAFSRYPFNVLSAMLGRGDTYRYYYGLCSKRGFLWSDLIESYEQMGMKYGKDLFENAVNKIRKAPKNTSDRLLNPEALGVKSRMPYLALMELLEKSEIGRIRNVLLSTIDPEEKQNFASVDFAGKMELADKYYEELVAQYGKEKVDKAVDIGFDIGGEGGYVAFRNSLGDGSNNPEFQTWQTFETGATAIFHTHKLKGYPKDAYEDKEIHVTLTEKTPHAIKLEVRSAVQEEDGSFKEPEFRTVVLKPWTLNHSRLLSVQLFYEQPGSFNPGPNNEYLHKASRETHDVQGRKLDCDCYRYKRYEGLNFMKLCYYDEVPGNIVSLARIEDGKMAHEVELIEFSNASNPQNINKTELVSQQIPNDQSQPISEVTTLNAEDVCETIYSIVDKMPELEGGKEALYSRIKYPEEAYGSGLQGRVFVTFVVSDKGQVLNAKILRGINELFDQKALEAVRTLKFKPGTKDGNPVCVQMNLPVPFRE